MHISVDLQHWISIRNLRKMDHDHVTCTKHFPIHHGSLWWHSWPHETEKTQTCSSSVCKCFKKAVSKIMYLELWWLTHHSLCYNLVFRSRDRISKLVHSVLTSGFLLQEETVNLLFMLWLQKQGSIPKYWWCQFSISVIRGFRQKVRSF